jgi:hypothetical protein
MGLTFTVEDVERRLLGLNASKGSGPDGTPPCILKSCSDGFKRPLTLLFNRSLSEGVFRNPGNDRTWWQYIRAGSVIVYQADGGRFSNGCSLY